MDAGDRAAVAKRRWLFYQLPTHLMRASMT